MKAHVEAGEIKAIAAVRVVLIAGAGILGERLQESRALFRRDFLQERVREDDLLRRGIPAFFERVGRVGLAVGVGEIGLDVVNGGLVCQICARDI